MTSHIPASHITALRTFIERVEGEGIRWVLTGSLSLALQGVSIQVGDIDILTDKEGAYRINKLLTDCEVRPVSFGETNLFRSYLGVFSIEGVQVEVMGELSHNVDGVWKGPVPPAGAVSVEYSGMKLPVFSLQYEYEAYRELGRHEKAERIRQRLEELNTSS